MGLSAAKYSALKNIYQDYMDAHLENMTKDTLLVFEAAPQDVSQEVFDTVRGHGSKKPDYTNMGNDEVRETKLIKSLPKYAPSEFLRYYGKIEEGQSIVRLKTYMSDMPDINRCDYVIPSYDDRGIFGDRYRLLRISIPLGFKSNRYAVTYWSKV